MADHNQIEQLFHVLDESAGILKEELDIMYLDALIETSENLFENSILQDGIHELAEKKLEKLYQKFEVEHTNKETIRKAIQLAVLKGMKNATQQHHTMTPDAIAIFVGYLVNKLTANMEEPAIFDPALGTGNLLFAVCNQLAKPVRTYGSEIDETLLKLAYISSNLQQQPLELFNQDSLEPLLLDPVDLVVSDLPVGYYPNDARSEAYQLKADEGHSYAHHLFIEQALRYTKDDGYLIFIIPNSLFETAEAEKLNKFIKDHAVIIGLIQLPATLFKNEKMAKSIFILQKKGENTRKPEQALLVDMPSFSNKQALAGMMNRLDKWFSSYESGKTNSENKDF